LPFVLHTRKAYVMGIKEIIMNWVFEAYSNVYNTALMGQSKPIEAPRAQGFVARLFGKR
jgi:hypothetical protein